MVNIDGYLRGLQLARLRRYRDAIGVFNNSLSGDPSDVAVLSEIAVCHTRLLNFKEARRAAENALQINPQWVRALFALGSTLLYDKKFKSRRPGDCPLSADRQIRQRHRLRLAANAVDMGLTILPRDANLLLLKAQISFESLAPRDAMRAVEMGLAISPLSPAFQRMRAIILQSFGDIAGAITASSTALRMDPTDPNSHHVAGWTALHAYQYEKPLQHFTESLRIDPTSISARRNAAFALRASLPFYRPIAGFLLFLQRHARSVFFRLLATMGGMLTILALMFGSGVVHHFNDGVNEPIIQEQAAPIYEFSTKDGEWPPEAIEQRT